MSNQRGFNMVGVIIASGLFAFLALAAAEFFSSMFKGIRAVDVKMQSQDFSSTLRLAMAKQDQCNVIFGLDKPVNPLQFPLSQYDLAVSGKEISVPVEQFTMAKREHRKDTEVQDLKIVDMSLRFSAPVTPGSDEHIGAFVVPLDLKKGKKMQTISQFLAKLPMRLKIEKDMAAGKAKIVACNSEAPAIDPRVVCIDLGGRWLEGDYMPKARCNVGGDIVLAANELPEDIPDRGGSNDDGERVELCFYQKSGDTRVKEYACPNTWGNRKGPRCAYDKTTHLWGVSEFNSSGNPKKLKFNCSKGVKVSVRTPDSGYLELTDPLYLGWDETAPSDTESPSGFSPTDQDRLTAVARCQYKPDAELFYDCNNMNAVNGLQGKAGSCVFVKGLKFGSGSDAASRINAYNTLNGEHVNPASFTGWVRVTSPRAALTGPARIREATGTPCFRTELHLANAGESGLAGPDGVLPAAFADDPTVIRQCAHEAAAAEIGSGAPATRKALFLCDNASLTKDQLEDLSVGQCWYVQDTRVAGYHPGPGAAPAGGGGSAATRYTGWVYMKSALPAGKFTLEADGSLKGTGNPQISAIPCNAGVRRPVDAPAAP